MSTASPDNRPAASRPLLTLLLACLYVALFVAMWLYQWQQPHRWAAGDDPHPFHDQLRAGTLVDFGALEGRLVRQGQHWRLLTATLLHGDLPHLLCNLTALLLLGILLEATWGSGFLLTLYVITGLIGNSVSAWSHQEALLQLGGSGALYGFYGFLATDLLLRRHPARGAVLAGFLFTLVAGAWLDTWFPVDQVAHLAGAASGVLLGVLLSRVPLGVLRRAGWLAGVLALAGLAHAAWQQQAWTRAQLVERQEAATQYVINLVHTLRRYAEYPGPVRVADPFRRQVVIELAYAEQLLPKTPWPTFLEEIHTLLFESEETLLTDHQREKIRNFYDRYQDILPPPPAADETPAVDAP